MAYWCVTIVLQATRVLVTHQLQYLPAADRVLVLRDGRLAEQGSYQELVARGVDFHQFQHSAEVEGEGAADGEGDSAGAWLAGCLAMCLQLAHRGMRQSAPGLCLAAVVERP